MQAWLCETLDGAEALHWRDLPTPEPGAGEVRIAIRAASLNFPDLLIVLGKYQFKPPLPFVPGAEFAGIVEAVGEGVSHLRPGMPVAALAGTGGFGTHAIVNASRVLPLPPGFALEDAAAFAFTYGTSHHALVDRAQLKAGETVLVLGAAGGVGTAALQIAKAVGARVIAAASTDENARCAASWAPTPPSTTRARTCAKRSRNSPRARAPTWSTTRWAAIWPSRPFAASLGAAATWSSGFAGGGIPALPWNLALLKGASVVGVFWGDFRAARTTRPAPPRWASWPSGTPRA
jgi:NADPH2:quinone reductase